MNKTNMPNEISKPKMMRIANPTHAANVEHAFGLSNAKIWIITGHFLFESFVGKKWKTNIKKSQAIGL